MVFGQVRSVQAKGIDGAMATWPALSLAGAPTRRSLHLVNRRRELALLSDTFERAKVRERAHLVTLLGEPGIGKTRVVEAFLGSLEDDVKVLAGRSTPFEEEVTFWPLAQMVYREIDRDRGAPEDEVADLLRAFVAEWVDDDDVDEAARRLALALGVNDGDGEEGRYHAAEVRRGLLSLLSGVASRGPVVLVFEDLHEADPLLLDLIEQLVKEARRVPLMVLCVARWEFLEDRPNWAGGIADAVTLWVEPLTMGHATELAMEAGDLANDDAERVARHAGGNPYFVVEIAGMLRREERDLPPSGPAATQRLLPSTVQAVIAARIDQLSPGARELVRRASVFPRGRFDLDELSLIVEPAQGAAGGGRRRGAAGARRGPPGVWRFGSDILRDVAYDSLAKRERQRLHLRVANKLAADEQLERFPRTIAFHLEQAARASLDLNPRDRAIAERAVDALAHAGDIARRRIESRSAADLYERALSLAGPDEDWGDREAWILGVLGEARYWLGEFDQAEAALHRALAVGGETERPGVRPRLPVPRRHHDDAARRRRSGLGVVRPVARGGAQAGRPVRAGAHPADGCLGAVPPQRARPGRGDVPGGARGRALGRPPRRLGRVALARGDRERAGDRGRTRKRCWRSRWRPSRWGRKRTRRSRRRSPTRPWRPRCGACSGWTKRWSMPSSRSARSASWAPGGSSRARWGTVGRSIGWPAAWTTPRSMPARRSSCAETSRNARWSPGRPPNSPASCRCRATRRARGRSSPTPWRASPRANPVR